MHPTTKEQYPVSALMKAMKEAGVSIQPNKGAKQQAIAALKLIQEKEVWLITFI